MSTRAPARRSLMRRMRPRRWHDRGAVAVEAALIVPLILLPLIFGTIEFTLLLRDYVAASSMVRAGARIASAEPHAGQDPLLPAVPIFANDAMLTIQREGSAMPKDNIKELWVYKANSGGFPDSRTDFSGCTNSCVRFKWDPVANKFNYIPLSGSWVASSVNACAGKNSSGVEQGDYVGVYLKANHKALIGIFGQGWAVSDYAVMKFEPVPGRSCLPS